MRERSVGVCDVAPLGRGLPCLFVTSIDSFLAGSAVDGVMGLYLRRTRPSLRPAHDARLDMTWF